jgi:threonine dehydrogenase-like Zn-dependent dehydrogenase
MASTMRAERFYADTKKVVLEDVPIPEPGPGEVLVKVAFCGICHSDLSGYQNVDIETLTKLVSLGRLDLSRSVSEIVSLEDVVLGIDKLERQEGNPIRILVKP